MRKSPSDTPTHTDAPKDSVTVLAVLSDMADTTWRVFVPTLSLLLVGRYLDVRLGTKPWLMLVGTALGAVLAWRLIVRQLSKDSKTIV